MMVNSCGHIANINGVASTVDDLKALALINYGHFTSMRVEKMHIKGFSYHLERLIRDCRRLFAAPLDPDRIRRYIRQALVGVDTAIVVRVTIFDPTLDIGRPSVTGEPSILVTTRPAAALPLPPLRLRSTTYTRDLPSVKHVGLSGTLWQRRTAQLNGFDDAVFTNPEGELSEGPTWNIGFYDGEQVIWPNAEVLPGVTMRLLQQAYGQTSHAPVTTRDLPRMQVAFATNATFGVRPIASIDTIAFQADHPILDTLRKRYTEIQPEALQ